MSEPDIRFDRTADGFTVSELPKAFTESREQRNGRAYTVFTWMLDATPVRTGEQSISFSFMIDVQLPGSRARSPLGFSSIFGGRAERVNLYTAPSSITILPLPSENQPESFSGAIGDFSTEIYVDHQQTTVGEPIMLSLNVIGYGNFDRIQGPKLEETEHWKVYPPQAIFEADAAGSGTKRFDYVLIPKQAGTHSIPELNFAFFDPKSEEYILSESPDLRIEVGQSATVGPTPIRNAELDTGAESIPALDLSVPLSAQEALLVPEYRLRTGRAIDSNPLKSPIYYTLNGSFALGVLGIAFQLKRRRRRQMDPSYRLIRRATSQLKQSLRDCANADSAEFYHYATRAIRQAATKRNGKNLLNADVEQLLNCLPESKQQVLVDFSRSRICIASVHPAPKASYRMPNSNSTKFSKHYDLNTAPYG